MGKDLVRIEYTNHRLERKEYNIIPHEIYFGHNRYHPVDQWLLNAFDVTRRVWREFAIRDIHSWKAVQ